MSPPSKKQEPTSGPVRPPGSPELEPAGRDEVDRARRRLLAMSVYVPPTVLGIIALNQAGCQPTPSCNPSTCNPGNQPCNPANEPCNPNTGCNPANCNPNTGCNPANCNPAA